jgi:hypothetical protein
MRIVWLLLVSFGLLSSCSKKQVVVPESVIPRDTMILMMTDIHLAEATIQIRNLGRSDTTRQEAYARYRYIYEKYKVGDDRFRESFEFYRSQPEYFHKMYDEVLTRLSEKQAGAQQ